MQNVIPMFALTGNPTIENIEQEICSFKKVGIEAVMIYPRSGCLVPYMSEEWFTLIQNVIDVCLTFDMKIWLYDEWNWPSGGCGGMVQQMSTENWSKKIVLTDGGLQVVADKKYPDLLNENAVKTFIQLTHERYYQRFGKYFGNLILGMFTDEPAFSYAVERTTELVYYNGMEQDYSRKTNRNFFEDAENYYKGNPHDTFMTDVFALYTYRMRENYIGTIADWCKNHNLLLTGHLLADTHVLQGTWDSGDTLSVLERFHMPGIDDIITRMGSDVLVAFAHIDAVKRKTNHPTMIELFALGPCDMSYNRKRRSLFMAAAHGIDHYFIAVAQLDAAGNYHKLRNYFNPESAMAPDYEKTKLFVNEAKIAAQYARKKSTPDVYIRYPREQMLSYLNHGREQGEACEAVLESTLTEIVNQQRTFGFAREDEVVKNALVIGADGIYNEKNGKKTTVQEFVKDLPAHTVKVMENGALAKNIFVKVYEDNTFIICDLEERTSPRNVEIHAPGKVYAQTLYPMQTVLQSDLCDLHALPVQADFRVEYEKGIYRPLLWDPQMFSVEQEITTVFYVRKYPAPNEILLDGVPLQATLPAKGIGHGFDVLYSMTEPVRLTVGEHKLTCARGSTEERFYLPVCILLGDFESDSNMLYQKPVRGNKAFFYGTAKFSANIQIPHHAKYLRFETNSLYTKVYANGLFLGEHAQECANIPLPSELQGKSVEFVFEQITTTAPLFGQLNNEYCNKRNHTPDWNIGWGPNPQPKGIGKIWFIK